MIDIVDITICTCRLSFVLCYDTLPSLNLYYMFEYFADPLKLECAKLLARCIYLKTLSDKNAVDSNHMVWAWLLKVI